MMRKDNRLALTTVLTLAVASLISLSAMADSRPHDGTSRDYATVAYRDNDRVVVEGRIDSVVRDRDGFRVHLERSGYSFWVPERVLRERRDEFHTGVGVRVSGYYRRGGIVVDTVDWLDRPVDVGHLAGWIDRVDYRRQFLVVRDERTNRLVSVDTIRADEHHRGLDIADLRRGDRVELSGHWDHDGFNAFRIDSVRKHH